MVVSCQIMVYVHCKFKRFVWTTLKEYVFLLQDVTFNIQYSGEPFLLIEGHFDPLRGFILTLRRIV